VVPGAFVAALKLTAAHLFLDDYGAIRANDASRNFSAVTLRACAVAAVIVITRSDVHSNTRYVHMNLRRRWASECYRNRTNCTHEELSHNNLLLLPLHKNAPTLLLVHKFVF
jgi:hypothetical protein